MALLDPGERQTAWGSIGDLTRRVSRLEANPASGGGAGIQFDTDPQSGDWLVVTTTSNDPSSPGASMKLESQGSGGTLISATAGEIVIDNSSTTNQTRILTGSASAGLEIADTSGAFYGINIHQNGDGPILITNDGGPGGITLTNDGDGPMLIRSTAAGGLDLLNAGAGDLTMINTGGGDFELRSTNGAGLVWAQDDLTISSHNGFVVFIDGFTKMPGLPTSDPATSDQIWNDSGLLVLSGFSGIDGGGP